MKIAQLEMNGPTTELEELKLVSSKYPVRITKYYKSLIKEKTMQYGNNLCPL